MAKNDFRVTSMFKIIIRICIKMLSFVRKHLSFYPKNVKERKELNQQVCLIKYVETEISNSTSHKKKERKRERERERERERGAKT